MMKEVVKYRPSPLERDKRVRLEPGGGGELDELRRPPQTPPKEGSWSLQTYKVIKRIGV